MIIKDETVYLNYIKDIENKVDNLRKNISYIPLSDTQRQSIEKICTQIFSQTALLSIRAKSKSGLILNSDWLRFKQETNGLYEQLSNIVNTATVAAEKIKANVIR